MHHRRTFLEHVAEHASAADRAHLDCLFQGLVRAVGEIVYRMARVGLLNLDGRAGDVNASGDDVKKLDLIANDILIDHVGSSAAVSHIGSEENEEPIACPDGGEGPYVFLIDPLDGSSNIDANVGVGTIFSVLRKRKDAKTDTDHFLQKGTEQVASGYVLYGPGTLLVYTLGDGTHGFTWDETTRSFGLSHPAMRTPDQGEIYSINEGYSYRWIPEVARYVEFVKAPREGRTPPSARYIGSMVSDVHRTLLYGGIFLYPEDLENERGKLRLLYEGNPLAYLAEQAGAAATTGSGRILEIQPKELHERVPLIIGSSSDVAMYSEFREGKR